MSRKPNGDRPPEVNIRWIPKDTKLPAKHWVVDYFDDDVDREHPYGHRHQIQCKSEGEAKKLGARVITELSRGIHTSPASSMTIADAAMSYLEACRLGICRTALRKLTGWRSPNDLFF